MSARGRSGIRTICTLIPLLCCSALGQQLQVENAASLRVGDIAVGSLAKLQLIYQGGAITPIDPPTVSVQFQPAAPGLTLRLQVLEVPDALSVLTLIPAEAPLGPGIVTLNYNGQSSSASVNIVSSSFGLYSGTGEMALAQNITTNGIQLNNLTHPAHPQDYVTLWGTGLGTSATDQVNVLLGGHPFPVTYAGPSASFAGLDQINFQVPDDPSIPQGCYVAVNVEAGNLISNLATLSLSRDSGPCQHPLGLSSDQLAQLDSGGQVNVGQIGLYSTIGPPAGASLSPSNGYVRTESASAQFLSYTASGLSVISGPLFADDYLAGCTFSGAAAASLLAVINALNVGNRLTVQGPGGKELDLLPENLGIALYSGSESATRAVNSPDQLSMPFFSAGQWQASSSGSSNVRPFTAIATLPNPIQVTNYDQLTTIHNTQDLTITWDPTTYSTADFVNIQLYNQVPQEWFETTPTLFCRVPATAGIATISAALLASFQPSLSGSLTLSVGRKSGSAAMFTVSLNDGTSIPSVFQYSSAEWIFVQFQ